MIYIIIGTQTSTGNEWVEKDTFDNAEAAAERCTVLRSFFDAKDSTYRVETVEPVGFKDATQLYADKLVAAETKDRLNAEFGKAKMDHEEGYPDTQNVGDGHEKLGETFYADTDSISETRTKDFTVTELFPDKEKYIPQEWCKECGAFVVYEEQRIIHTAWHNKLLP